MANNFDFELKATDSATAVVKKIDDTIQALNKNVDSAKDKLADQDKSKSGLGDVKNIIDEMDLSMKTLTDSLGKMSPELSGIFDIASKFIGPLSLGGIIGGVSYGIDKITEKIDNRAKWHQSLKFEAENSNLAPEQLSKLTQTFGLYGIDKESAANSVTGLYPKFNNALQGRDFETLNILRQIGVNIVRDKNGLADVEKTFNKLIEQLSKQTPATQSTVANVLGLDESILKVVRGGSALYKERVDQTIKSGVIDSNEEIKRNASFADKQARVEQIDEGKSKTGIWGWMVDTYQRGREAVLDEKIRVHEMTPEQQTQYEQDKFSQSIIGDGYIPYTPPESSDHQSSDSTTNGKNTTPFIDSLLEGISKYSNAGYESYNPYSTGPKHEPYNPYSRNDDESGAKQDDADKSSFQPLSGVRSTNEQQNVTNTPKNNTPLSILGALIPTIANDEIDDQSSLSETISKAIQDGMELAVKENKIEVEIKLVSDKGGTRVINPATGSGYVSIPMNVT